MKRPIDGEDTAGMDGDILLIRLAMEAKRYDEMVDRIEKYLKDKQGVHKEK